MPRIKISNLRGAQGTFQPTTGQITLSVKLDSRAWESKKFVLYHELFHAYIDKHNLKFSAGNEELICDLYALSKCKPSELSLLQALLKKLLIKKYGNLSRKTILSLDLNNLL